MQNKPTDEFWQLAQEVCTQRQFRVLELRERHGMSIYQIAYMIDRDPTTVRGHLRAAAHNVTAALDRGSQREGGLPSFSANVRSSSASGLDQARL